MGQRVRRISRLGSCAHSSGECGGLKGCTVNVGSLKGMSREVVEMLSKRGVDIWCLQEVGICIKSELAGSVIEVERFGDRLMKVKMVLGKTVFLIFSIYAPQVGRSEEEKENGVLGEISG